MRESDFVYTQGSDHDSKRFPSNLLYVSNSHSASRSYVCFVFVLFFLSGWLSMHASFQPLCSCSYWYTRGAPPEQVQLFVLPAREQLCLTGPSFSTLLKGAPAVVVIVVIVVLGGAGSYSFFLIMTWRNRWISWDVMKQIYSVLCLYVLLQAWIQMSRKTNTKNHFRLLYILAPDNNNNSTQ